MARPYEPDWLDAGFVKKALKHSENDESIEVKKLTTKPATAKGDNYSSDMIRVDVEYSRDIGGRRIPESRSLIVKISPIVEGPRKDLIVEAGIFNTEIKMMGTVLAEMNDLLSHEGHRLSARILYTQTGDPTVLVIEDLAPLGYRMADRMTGLDLCHTRLVMRGIAKFHATSVAVVEKEPSHSRTIVKGIFHEDHPDNLKSFCYNGLMNLAKELHNWPELGPSYGKKLEKLADVAYAKATEISKPSTDEFQVINHGDCWLNNMLFRYDEQGKPVGHIFVDFQMCVWTSPAIDILYFLNTSTSLEVLLNYRDALIKEYHDTLVKTMLKIGCKTRPPSLAALEESIEKRELYGLITACVCLPIILTEKNEAADFNEILGESGAYDNPTIKKPIFRNRMLRLLPDWNARGLLDV